MGLINNHVCDVCGEKVPSLFKVKIIDGIICRTCIRISTSCDVKTIEEVKHGWEINDQRLEKFAPTQILKQQFTKRVTSIDYDNKLFTIEFVTKPNVFTKKQNCGIKPIVYAFNEVSNYRVEKEPGQTVTKKKHGIARAVVGGAVAGKTGAVVGATTASEKTMQLPGTTVLSIDFMMSCGPNSCVIFGALPIGLLGFLDKCIAESKSNESENTTVSSSADELLKLKSLLDNGILTQEEFEAEKAKILNR